ncbi:MAG: sigma-70 family RNA polymerase sigma factor [Clostridiales Family XIII bacterium]|jgi:RNA polymerase sigma-70 factor (ECF subfamily)|nr:sigma-70 family RNA polymerase sigma factor [Clostridiales Family XIII bacterium]
MAAQLTEATIKDLIEKASKGDEHSFEALILSCKQKAWNMALQYMRNENDAMDVMQEVFIKIFRKLKEFKGDCRFDTWVYRITVNACMDMLRKRSRALRRDAAYYEDIGGGYGGELVSRAHGPEESLSDKELSEELLKCVERLPLVHREVIVMRDIRNLSYEEISDILEMPLGTVKSRINRARNSLKEMWLEQKRKENV